MVPMASYDWAVNMDKKIRGLPYDEPLYESVKKEIPMDLKWKYMTLYRDNDTFNQMLIDFSTKHPVTDLVIGQDDAHPFGLPNYNRLNVKSYVKNYDVHPPIMTSQGADELGALAASRIYLQESGHRPRVKVLYGSDAMKDYTLPFVPLTLQEIAEEKDCPFLAPLKQPVTKKPTIISSFTAARTARKITVPWPTG